MILYHGSNVGIDEIDFSKSKVGKDFGVGFYLTRDKETAMRQAVRKTEQLGVGSAIVTAFLFDEIAFSQSGLTTITFEDYSQEWAEFVLQNRNNKTRNNIHNYDMVYGPIANDTVGYQIRRFTSGIIDLDKLMEELKNMRGIQFQYFFGTESSIKNLKKI